ncbi:transketolase family protein [candidate division KSB3 bacterium]|uniref:Transketolase family protein n=1 Tax=candidate division KSB3 bacterium TaxID=2044937 RepID=A0A9D5JX97_9BACT|nr:transketolase family protein [candidate division KSB3 bacterium]MBD3325928.1 transketolase family protein [candidate division KSB3 bacterium]
MAQFIIPDRHDTQEMRYQMGYALADLAHEYDNIVALDADLRSSSGLHIFEQAHPDKLLKVGIAEQNLIALSAGLSQEGFLPFPCTFDAFCRRFMDQLYVSVAYSNLNVKVLGAYVGLFTGKAGATHQSDKELGLLLRIPNLRVVEPGCNVEMAQVLRCSVETPGPFYIRIVRCQVADNELFDGYRFELGKGVTVVDEGTDVGLICTGYMIKTAKRAAQKLKAQGIGVRVDHHPSLKPFDRTLVFDLAQKVSALVTLENHCVSGGLYSLVAESLVSRGMGIPVGAIGTDPEDFIHTGHVNDLLYRYNMTSDDVVEKAIRLLHQGGAHG